MSWKSFPADRGTLRQLTVAGSGGGISLNFDAMLLGERIFWDAATDTLTIKGTPPNLRDQLQRRTGSGSKLAESQTIKTPQLRRSLFRRPERFENVAIKRERSRCEPVLA